MAANPTRILSAQDQPVFVVGPAGIIFMDSDKLLRRLRGLPGYFERRIDDSIKIAATLTGIGGDGGCVTSERKIGAFGCCSLIHSHSDAELMQALSSRFRVVPTDQRRVSAC